jgi:aromatic ring-opening dioxygenase catalytic subunit (LigB family)
MHKGVLVLYLLIFSSFACSNMSVVSSVVQPVWLLSHGAGPCFFTEGGTFAPIDSRSAVAESYRNLAKTLPKRPSVVLVISAHHQSHHPGLELVGDTDEEIALLFDYYGFPKHTYEITWPARGSKQLARRIRELLPGIHIDSNNKRGFDHGVFVPLKLVFPDPSEIRVVQLSISDSLDPTFHLNIGKQLAALRNENVLVIGSGQATHGQGPLSEAQSFVDWLGSNVGSSVALAKAEKEAPHFRKFHTPSEHFVPWIVASAATGKEKADSKLLLSGWFHSLALHSYSLS